MPGSTQSGGSSVSSDQYIPVTRDNGRHGMKAPEELHETLSSKRSDSECPGCQCPRSVNGANCSQILSDDENVLEGNGTAGLTMLVLYVKSPKTYIYHCRWVCVAKNKNK